MSVADLKNDLNNRAREGAEQLGELVWWTLGGVEVLSDHVRALVDGLGAIGHDGQRITADAVCPKIQPRGAIRKTLDELNIRSGAARRKAKGVASERTLIARRYDASSSTDIKPGDFHVAIVEEHLGHGARPTFTEVQRIRYDSANAQIGLETGLLATEIQAGFIKYGKTYRSSDVGRVVAQLIELGHGILAREAGGVYFLPRQHAGIAQAVDQLCAGIDGASFTRMPILGGGAGSTHVVQTRELAGKAIRDELARLEADLVDLQAQASTADGPTLRGSTIKNRLDRYKTLRHKASTYRDLLSLEDEAVREAINKMTRAAKALLDRPDPKQRALVA